MIDQFGREIIYLRLSVTTQCNLNCLYCRPGGCPDSQPRRLLSASEIGRIVGCMAGLGIRKVRLTGGEPLLRRDLTAIIRAVLAAGAIEDLSMTTNAQGLAARAAGLREAGLQRINISLDSLRPDRFSRITGGGSLDQVLAGIDACAAVGLAPIKLNVVLIRGINDDEIADFIGLTRDRPLELRFIELMPMNELDSDPARMVTGSEILAAWPALQRLPVRQSGQVAEDFRLPGHLGTVGFIRPISHRFCPTCNRIRLTADGRIKPCLGDNGEVTLLDALNGSDDELRQVIADAIWHKPEGHQFAAGFRPLRGMDRTGG